MPDRSKSVASDDGTAAPLNEAAYARAFSAALRAVRKRRGLRAADVAAAMGMPLRSYEYFESGRGRPSFVRVARFAEATNSDIVAILAAAALDRPALALHCMDNKLMLILLYAVDAFEGDLGPDIAELESSLIISAFTRMFGEMAQQVRKRDALAAAWLEARAPARPGWLPWRRKPG